MAEYIEREKLIDELEHLHEDAELSYLGVYDCVKSVPTADVVPVVRCKDCKHFQPAFVQTNDGERRPYTEEEKQSGFGLVSAEKGINCGSRCERLGYWEQNSIPVWFSENDYCSYAERIDKK